jgi:hypothetical protein
MTLFEKIFGAIGAVPFAAFASVIGVFVGWFLSVIAAGFKSRQDKRRALGLLLTKLIALESHVYRASLALVGLRNTFSDPVVFERARAMMFKGQFMEGDAEYTAIKKCIDDSAAFDPISAVKLSSILHVLHGHKDTDLKEMASDATVHSINLTLLETALASSEIELRRVCLRYAWGFSVATYLRLWFLLRARKKKEATNVTNLDFISGEFKKYADKRLADEKSTV